MKHDLQSINNYLGDYLALSEAKARYCRMLDTKDWAGFGNLMIDEFVLDVTEGSQIPVIKGRAAAVQQIQASILIATTVHQVHSPEMQIEGDTARVIWAMQDRIVWGPERASLTGYGHYHERWLRRNGEWKIASLRLTRLHVDFQPAARA